MAGLTEITDGVLGGDARLIGWLTEWFGWARLPPSRYLLSRGLACAQRALENGFEPHRLFLSLIDRGFKEDWRSLSPDAIAVSERRLAELAQETLA